MTRLSLLRQGSPLAKPAVQLRVINAPGAHPRFDGRLARSGLLLCLDALERGNIPTLDITGGRLR